MREKIQKIKYQEIQDIFYDLLEKIEDLERYTKVHSEDIKQLDDTIKRVASAAGVADIPYY